MQKKCCTCCKWLPLTGFYRTKSNKDGLSVRCKSCCNASVKAWQQTHRKERNAWSKQWRDKNWEKITKQARYNKLRRVYGLSNEEFDSIFAAQKECCAICERRLCKFPSREQQDQIAFADHNHETNTFRAFLCPRCNALLGLADDSIALLETSIAYLKRHDNSVVSPSINTDGTP